MGSGKFAGLKMARKQQEEREQRSETVEQPSLEQPAASGPTPRQEADVPVRRGRPPGKRSSSEHTQITAYIRKKTHHAVKLALLQANDERDFSELIDELLAEWVQAQP